MPNQTIGLSRIQSKNIEEFLDLFADIEKILKAKLERRINDRTGFCALIDQYSAKNPYWTDSADRLRTLAEIRNLLTHQRSIDGYPIALAPNSMHTILEIRKQLLKPDPVSMRYRRAVMTVGPADFLASVLALAFENGFSQFPVINDGRFAGLITETEIIRWLGHQTRRRSAEVNLAAVTVRMVLKEKDPSLQGIRIFHFERLDTPVEEVMGRFSVEPALEAVLLTTSGKQDTPLEGIVTQWDAARYPG
jgi:CBS domain-containing protein